MLVLLLITGPAQAAAALLLDDREAVAVWPSVQVRLDPEQRLDVAQVLAQPEAFELPGGTPGNVSRAA